MMNNLAHQAHPRPINPRPALRGAHARGFVDVRARRAQREAAEDRAAQAAAARRQAPAVNARQVQMPPQLVPTNTPQLLQPRTSRAPWRDSYATMRNAALHNATRLCTNVKNAGVKYLDDIAGPPGSQLRRLRIAAGALVLGVACAVGAYFLLAAQLVKCAIATAFAAVALLAVSVVQAAPFVPEASKRVVEFVKTHKKEIFILSVGAAAVLAALASGVASGLPLAGIGFLGGLSGYAAYEVYEKTNSVALALVAIAILFAVGVIYLRPAPLRSHA